MPEYDTKTEYNEFTTTIHDEVRLYKGCPFLDQYTLDELTTIKYTAGNVWHTLDMLKSHVSDYKRQCIQCNHCHSFVKKREVIVYNCGHTYCKTCNKQNKTKCPDCFETISHRIQLRV